MSPTLKKLMEAKNDGTRIEYKKEFICVYFKDKLEFGVASSNILFKNANNYEVPFRSVKETF